MEFSVSTSWTLLSENDKDGILRKHDDSDVNFEIYWSAKKIMICNCKLHDIIATSFPLNEYFSKTNSESFQTYQNSNLSHLGWAIIKWEEMSTKIRHRISYTFLLPFWKLFFSELFLCSFSEKIYYYIFWGSKNTWDIQFLLTFFF